VRRLGIALIAVALLAGGCAAVAEPPVRATWALLAATAEGAIAVDRATDSLVGFDRAGARRWTEPAALIAGATFTCLRQCPDAILSYGYVGDGPDRMPKRVGTVAADPFPVSDAHRRRVLTARTERDLVVEETDRSGTTTLRLVRGDGAGRRVPVSHQDQVWVETHDRAHAMAFTRIPGATGATVRWFVRDASGWQPVGPAMARGAASNGCLGDDGNLAVITGRESALILRREIRIPITLDIPSAGECAVGPQGAVLIGRSIGDTGQVRTAVRGIDPRGRPTWTRDYPGEALVTMNPSGDRVAIAYDGTLDILDATGATRHTEPGIGSARYTGDRELVVASLSGGVRWITPPE
jgi:hypothetical protein